MTVKTSPKKLLGAWKEGYALDLHTLRSTFLGTDSFGHDVFDTTRSEIGELLYRLKYRRDLTALTPIAETTAAFLKRWHPGVDALVPVPPSKTGRQFQPVLKIAREVCERAGIQLCNQCIKKVRDTGQLKDVFDLDKRAAALKGAFAVARGLTEGKRLLLFDDLYRSGATATEISRSLMSDGRAEAVFLLTLTRTRSRS